MEAPRKHWHLEAIPQALEETARSLAMHSWIRDFYLAGGTALALHLGHRRSRDLDLRSPTAFDEDQLAQQLQGAPGLAVLARQPRTLHCRLETIKVSFIAYEYPLLRPLDVVLGLRIADPVDIACMKVNAIASRGTRRDFVDLYFLARSYGLAAVLDWFAAKFAGVGCSRVHVLKSLVYFEDAEQEPMPDMLFAVSWEKLTEYFTREVPALL